MLLFAPSPSVADDGRSYRPPVTASVLDPYRPPPQPWMPGNRGIEYDTARGELVRAIGPGRVTFAGPVAGTLHVTVRHPDGLRSSYSNVGAVRVRVGHTVAAGHVVAVAAGPVHLGVREGDEYIDPASLWGDRVQGGRVALIPLRLGRALGWSA